MKRETYTEIKALWSVAVNKRDCDTVDHLFYNVVMKGAEKALNSYTKATTKLRALPRYPVTPYDHNPYGTMDLPVTCLISYLKLPADSRVTSYNWFGDNKKYYKDSPISQITDILSREGELGTVLAELEAFKKLITTPTV